MHSETAAKKAVEEGAVFEETTPEQIGTAENTVSMRTIQDFACHAICTFEVITIATSGAKAGFTAKTDVVEFVAMVANKSGIAVFAAIDEFFCVFNDDIAKFYALFKHFREVVCKNRERNLKCVSPKLEPN